MLNHRRLTSHQQWTRAKAAKNRVRTALEGTARGAARCMSGNGSSIRWTRPEPVC